MNASVLRPAPTTRRDRAFRMALCASALTAAGLTAGAAAEVPAVVRVPYGDLNLTSDAGTQALLRRLSVAAHKLCDDNGIRELDRVVHAAICYREALENAVVAVHNERLSTLYHAKGVAGAT